MSETTQELLNELEHYGVKGMKWGVRKDRSSGNQGLGAKDRYRAIRNKELMSMTVKTRNGTKVNIDESQTAKPMAFVKTLRANSLAKDASFKHFSLSVGGKKVGDARFERVSDDELYLMWLGVKKSERGKGYATAVFDAAVQYGRATGVKEITLEVPGISPDARHIYEKQGFVVDQKKTDAYGGNNADLWGGLTYMRLDVNNKRLSHSDLSEEEELELALIQTFPQFTDEMEAQIMGEDPNEVVEHLLDETGDDSLEHYGVLGMKWGVRKDRSSKSSGTKKKSSRSEAKAKKKKAAAVKKAASDPKNMSNEELRRQNERMRLEQEFKRLKKEARPSAGPVVDYLSEMGNRQIKRVANQAIDYGVDALLESAGFKVNRKKKK